ncbi:MAG: hypothetical protein GX033_01015 [Firmicutes bacterium]|nr:hypothetical protein [Bacillota bacterium]
MWLWALAAGLFALAALLFFLLYRRAKLALEYWSNPANALTVDGVAVLIEELESAGEIIVERLEVKQREVEQLLKLLDAKLELLQAALALREERPEVKEEAAPGVQVLGEKQQQVLHWHQQGLTPVEIARQTDLKIDEVRLILSLFASDG